MTQTPWLSSAATHCGAVREMNEDAFLSRESDGFWVVADGMGGHDAGEVASEMITTSLGKVDVVRPLADVVDAIEDSLLDVHKKIRDYSRTHCEGRTMGSTVVTLFARGSVGVCMWAGDSRLYRFRNKQLEAISEDHSQVNELLIRGMITAEEAVNHPASNVITRAVGASESLYIDITVLDLQHGDTYLLCSDGLYGALSEKDISEQLVQDSVESITDTLIKSSLAAGAKDNVTVTVVKIP